MIRFHVPGKPVAKARPRVTTVNGKARSYTPAKTVNYESMVALAASKAMNGDAIYEGPVRIDVTATFPIPKGWSQKKRASRPIHWHTARPDGDNILKAISDGMNDVVFRDDSQVAFAKVQKIYGDTPGVEVMVEALP